MIAERASLNPDGDVDVRLLCLLYLVQAATSRAADHPFRGVLQYVCVHACLIVCDLETSTMRRSEQDLV
jgi:hypothetical protein